MEMRPFRVASYLRYVTLTHQFESSILRVPSVVTAIDYSWEAYSLKTYNSTAFLFFSVQIAAFEIITAMFLIDSLLSGLVQTILFSGSSKGEGNSRSHIEVLASSLIHLGSKTIQVPCWVTILLIEAIMTAMLITDKHRIGYGLLIAEGVLCFYVANVLALLLYRFLALVDRSIEVNGSLARRSNVRKKYLQALFRVRSSLKKLICYTIPVGYFLAGLLAIPPIASLIRMPEESQSWKESWEEDWKRDDGALSPIQEAISFHLFIVTPFWLYYSWVSIRPFGVRYPSSSHLGSNRPQKNLSSKDDRISRATRRDTHHWDSKDSVLVEEGGLQRKCVRRSLSILEVKERDQDMKPNIQDNNFTAHRQYDMNFKTAGFYDNGGNNDNIKCNDCEDSRCSTGDTVTANSDKKNGIRASCRGSQSQSTILQHLLHQKKFSTSGSSLLTLHTHLTVEQRAPPIIISSDDDRTFVTAQIPATNDHDSCNTTASMKKDSHH
eukprot:jgi/Bigna1/126499/aug1.2_g1207